MTEKSEPYSLEKAQEKAAELREKITAGKVQTYAEAEKLVDSEKQKGKIIILDVERSSRDFSEELSIKLKDLIENGDYLLGEFQDKNVSNIDSKTKYSLGYKDCVGFAAFGLSRRNQENISLLTHNSLYHVLDDNVEEEGAILEKAAEKFVRDTEEFGRKIFIIGGNMRTAQLKEDYQKAISFISDILLRKGIQPEVLRPNAGGPVDIYLDTLNQKLYLIRSETQKQNR